MSGNVVVQFGNVTRRYGPVLGLNDVSLEIRPGITGLVGPNGAGKTTFLNLVVGLHYPSSGDVKVFGSSPFTDAEVRRRVGYCPDGEATWDWMDGLTFVTTLGIWTGLKPEVADQRARELMDALEMNDALNKRISEYSRGMRQKVKVAQAIIHQPELLILDEPLNGVDPLSRHQILVMLEREAARGVTVVVSSHVLHELGEFVDEVLLLQRGRLLASGPVDSIRDLLDEHPHSVRVICREPRRLATALLGLEGTVSAMLLEDGDGLEVRTREPALFYSRLPEVILNQKVSVSEVYATDNDLESVFKYLVKGGGG
jgi:ABC-2 type transport system ATP-binding protein